MSPLFSFLSIKHGINFSLLSFHFYQSNQTYSQFFFFYFSFSSSLYFFFTTQMTKKILCFLTFFVPLIFFTQTRYVGIDCNRQTPLTHSSTISLGLRHVFVSISRCHSKDWAVVLDLHNSCHCQIHMISPLD